MRFSIPQEGCRSRSRVSLCVALEKDTQEEKKKKKKKKKQTEVGAQNPGVRRL